MDLRGLEWVEPAGFADGKWRKIPRKDLQASDWSSRVGGNAKCIDETQESQFERENLKYLLGQK